MKLSDCFEMEAFNELINFPFEDVRAAFNQFEYCQGARLRQLREDKHRAKKKARNERKRSTSLDEYEDYEEEKD